ncbi:MAG: hypothetical protein RIQ52_748 [Pseudomonadota bacterium]
MARKKAHVDEAIARADTDKGLLLVLTGNGKGKSSSAFGMVARTLGHGRCAGVAQFIKGSRNTGEELCLGGLPGVDWQVLGEGFTWDTQNRERDTAMAEAGWAVAQGMLRNPAMHLVVLDELTYCLNYGYLDESRVLADIAARCEGQHVVVTGRAASDALLAMADTVTEMRDVKHAFREGIRAQAGVDW